MPGQSEWGGSLHLTFRLLPEPSPNLRPFLEADGLNEQQVLERLPYQAARARGRQGATPDRRRYRDGRHIYQLAGLLYEDADGVVRVTELGRATLRWLDMLTPKNARILGRHAAYALSAAQLVNPTRAGQRYDQEMRVFPFAFVWRAMLALENRISSDELNRALFRVRSEADLAAAIDSIRTARATGDPSAMGAETISGPGKNDRVIPWVALASFGWTLISDKRPGDAAYTIPQETRSLLSEAAQLRRRHLQFASIYDYVAHLSRCAALPADLR